MVARQRRGGADWWLGGITDTTRRKVDVDLSFLDKGRRYTAEIWRDGPGGGIDGNRFAMIRVTREVRAGDELSVVMESGGGGGLSLTPKGRARRR